MLTFILHHRPFLLCLSERTTQLFGMYVLERFRDIAAKALLQAGLKLELLHPWEDAGQLGAETYEKDFKMACAIARPSSTAAKTTFRAPGTAFS